MESGYLSGITGRSVIRSLETIDDTHGLDFDTGPIEGFAASVSEHYERLAEHLTDTRENDRYDDPMNA